MDFLRNLFYVEVDTPEGPRVVSRFFDYLSVIDYPVRAPEEQPESLVETDESIEEGGSGSSEEEPEAVSEEYVSDESRSEDGPSDLEDLGERLREIQEQCRSQDIEDPFVRRDYEHILARIDALLSNLNGFLQVPETVTGTQPNGTIIKKKDGKVFLSRQQDNYRVGIVIEDQSFDLFASYRIEE